MYYEVIYLLAFSFNILSNMCMYMHSVQNLGAGQDNQVYTDKTPNMYMLGINKWFVCYSIMCVYSSGVQLLSDE